jgi:CRISPR-associated protein Cas1
MLGHDCRSAREAHGLDPQVGFLPDRVALSLVNRRQVGEADFVVEAAGGVLLTDEARKTVLTAWQDRKRDDIRHPFLGEVIPFGLLAFTQAQLLARHLRGDLDGYLAFFWR